jgi:hypothetical protein
MNVDCSDRTLGLQDAEDFVASHALDLRDSVGITKNHTNLGRGKTLLGALHDLLNHLGSGGLEP